MDFSLLVPDHSGAYGLQFLLLSPISSHVHELRAFVEKGIQFLHILLGHPVPFCRREVRDGLLLGSELAGHFLCAGSCGEGKEQERQSDYSSHVHVVLLTGSKVRQLQTAG